MAAMRAVGIGHRLPAHANVRDDDPDLITALYVHGTLELHVPRREIDPRRVSIEHGSPFVGDPNAEPC
jgi:hypothetical protein